MKCSPKILQLHQPPCQLQVTAVQLCMYLSLAVRPWRVSQVSISLTAGFTRPMAAKW